jgi:CubicO group peptidase (beta-lactamase class C family)
MKSLLRKIFRFTVVFIIGVLVSVNAYILLSGRLYLYKGVMNTYLIGRTGPSIYDKDVFYSSTIEPAKKSDQYVIPSHEKANTQKIPKDYRNFIEDLDTRAFLVFKRDTLIYEEYWDEHVEKTVSNSFSVAKTIVAMLIGIAVEEGKIGSLDDKVAKYIPEFKNKGRDKITIRHLLQMSSGLDWEESGKNPFSDNAESYYGTDLYGHVTRQNLVSEPGTKFLYQSGNSQLLSFVLEKATGEDLTEYAHKKIWSKVGATNEAYWNLDKENGDEKAFCCFYANARDFSRLGLMLENKGQFNGEQILPDWYYKEMTQLPQLETEDGISNYRYGLHLWVYLGNSNPVYYCRGIKGQYIITIPEEDLTIIRMGEDRKDNFTIPEHLQDDKVYIEENKYEVGHCLGLFQYIALGKMLASQIEE